MDNRLREREGCFPAACGARNTFRRLIGDARRELARHYLLQPALELGEVACLLEVRGSQFLLPRFPGMGGSDANGVAHSAAGYLPPGMSSSSSLTKNLLPDTRGAFKLG
jgi:hypothetical protein